MVNRAKNYHSALILCFHPPGPYYEMILPEVHAKLMCKVKYSEIMGFPILSL